MGILIQPFEWSMLQTSTTNEKLNENRSKHIHSSLPFFEKLLIAFFKTIANNKLVTIIIKLQTFSFIYKVAIKKNHKQTKY